MKDEFALKYVWTFSSPDLKPCSYWIWNEVEELSNDCPHNNIKFIKKNISSEFQQTIQLKPATRSDAYSGGH